MAGWPLAPWRGLPKGVSYDICRKKVGHVSRMDGRVGTGSRMEETYRSHEETKESAHAEAHDA